jgi:hypothetical protein
MILMKKALSLFVIFANIKIILLLKNHEHTNSNWNYYCYRNSIFYNGEWKEELLNMCLPLVIILILLFAFIILISLDEYSREEINMDYFNKRDIGYVFNSSNSSLGVNILKV